MNQLHLNSQHRFKLGVRAPRGYSTVRPTLLRAKAAAQERINVEMDDRYRRTDMSEVHAWEARRAFAKNVVRGEAGMSLASAALQIVAEDDAIASHSTVPFPVGSWLQRIQNMVDDIAIQLTHSMPSSSCDSTSSQDGSTTSSSSGSSSQSGARRSTSTASPSDVVALVEDYLFVQQRIRIPESGRSGLPAGRTVPLACAYDDSRLAYMSELLVRRIGHPGLVAILYSDVMRRLMEQGIIDFAVAMDTRDFAALPRAVVLPGMTRSMMLGAPLGAGVGSSSSTDSLDGDARLGMTLNTCTSEALLELLRQLKRAYWPFEWDAGVDSYEQGGQNSHGGFRAAAKVATGEEMSALLRAAGRSGSWRLANGIWTSPRAGDIRRACAACERLVMVAADQYPEERRDLAVLQLHMGNLPGAAAELKEYMAMPAFARADGLDRLLCRKMAASLEEQLELSPKGDDAGRPPYRVVDTFSVLERPAPVQREDDRKPLTW